MSTATATARRTGRGSGRGPGRGAGRWLADHLVLVLGLLVLVYMTVPVLVVMLMSFNDPASRNSYSFDGFTLANWTDVCGPFQLCEALVTSLQIGLLATLGATLLGTLMAFAMVRHRFRGRSAANLLIFLPMATPEVVMGSSLLALFVNVGVAGFLGFWTILVAHVLFCLSFVVVTVKARLAGLDPRLEQAAMDLYANEWQTFWRISFPLVFPGINAGQEVTFPMFVWGAAQRGIPPQINVVGTIMFLVAMSVVLVGELGSRRRAGR